MIPTETLGTSKRAEIRDLDGFPSGGCNAKFPPADAVMDGGANLVCKDAEGHPVPLTRQEAMRIFERRTT